MHGYSFQSVKYFLSCACAGATFFYKALSNDGIPVSVYLPAQRPPKPSSLQIQYFQLAVIVDVACAEGVTFVAQVSNCNARCVHTTSSVVMAALIAG